MKIYTKSGDKGETSLVTGHRVKKNNSRIEAYGTLDELNSFLGLAASLDSSTVKSSQNDFIRRIQNQLFNVGSRLACDDSHFAASLPKLDAKIISEMELKIDELTAQLPPLKNFILPGGSQLSSYAHIGRTIARRAERLCVALDQELPEDSKIDEFIIPLLNRLSDYLFVLARYYNHLLKISDIEWSK